MENVVRLAVSLAQVIDVIVHRKRGNERFNAIAAKILHELVAQCAFGQAGKRDFSPDVIEYPGQFPGHMIFADFNGDGSPDLATATGGETNGLDTGRVTIWLNEGIGNFTKHAEYPIGPIVTDIHVADLNGDGTQDLLVHDDWMQELWVFLNQGNAQFKVDVKLKGTSSSFTVGDLNGDGKPDVASGHGSKEKMLVLFNGCTP